MLRKGSGGSGGQGHPRPIRPLVMKRRMNDGNEESAHHGPLDDPNNPEPRALVLRRFPSSDLGVPGPLVDGHPEADAVALSAPTSSLKGRAAGERSDEIMAIDSDSSRIARLGRTVVKMQEELEWLLTCNQRLRADVDILKARNERVETEVEALKARNECLEVIVTKTKNDFSNYKAEVSQKIEKYGKAKDEVAKSASGFEHHTKRIGDYRRHTAKLLKHKLKP